MNEWQEWVRIHGDADWEEGEYRDFYLMLRGCMSPQMEGYYHRDGKAA